MQTDTVDVKGFFDLMALVKAQKFSARKAFWGCLETRINERVSRKMNMRIKIAWPDILQFAEPEDFKTAIQAMHRAR